MPKSINLRDWEVRGLLAGRIAALCRVVKPGKNQSWLQQKWIDATQKVEMQGEWVALKDSGGVNNLTCVRSPFGAPGDVLAGLEAWQTYSYCPGEYGGVGELGYAVDPSCGPSSAVAVVYKADGDEGKWRSAQTMPAWAVRLHLTTVSVRCCRVQEVQRTDALRLGISVLPLQSADDPSAWYQSAPGVDQERTPQASYRHVFDRDNGHAAWERNPWVWIGEVKR